jgi:hypothetical protein
MKMEMYINKGTGQGDLGWGKREQGVRRRVRKMMSNEYYA